MAIQEGNPFVQRLSQQVWMENYKWETDETVWDTFRRVAKCVASIEKDKKYWEEKYYELLSEFKYIPGGRILSNAGTNLRGTTYNNCFVGGFRGKNQDSISSIYEELARQAKTLASEGGYGCNFDVLRPRGSFVTGIGVETSGTIQFMELWDISSSALTKGSGTVKKDSKGKNKIRKGAMLGCLSCWNPGIEEFIVAKRNPGMLTKFNLSVLITKEFIECVKKDLPWNLEFPDTTFEKYDDEWDGNLRKWKEKEYPVHIWKTFESACELWDLIITSTYTRNEPGVIFIDRVNELNNLYYCESISAANPCLTGDTIVATADGRNGVTIKQLAEESKGTVKFPVYAAKSTAHTYKSKGKWKTVVKNAVAFKTGIKEIIEVVLSDGTTFSCTPNHLLALNDGSWIKAEESEGSHLAQFYTFSNKNSAKNYRTICSKTNAFNSQYRMIWEFYNGEYDGTAHNIDHINECASNDAITNLQLIPCEEHTEKSRLSKMGKNNPIFKMDVDHRKWVHRKRNILANASKYDWSGDRKKAAMTEFIKKNPKPLKEDKNIYMDYDVYVEEIVRLGEYEDVYDLTVEDTSNFYIITNTDDSTFMNCSGVLVHNCAEEPLPVDGSCNLGSINITQYVNEKKEGIDFSKLKEDIPAIVRFQDAIIDLTNYPLAGQKEEGIKKRRVGIGYTGYGSMLYLLKIPYASEEALKFTEKMVKLITNQIYQASSDLAQEKGCFPSFDSEKYLKSKFVKQALTETTIEKIRQQGIRNSHLTTIAPTGNTSIFANNCSGGLEPVVSAKYTRTIIESNPPEDLIQPINIDWDLHTYEVENGWEWIMEGDEWILSKTFNDIIYKIDRNRGLTREEEVSDYAVLQMGQDFDEKAEYAKNIFNLKVEEHIETMKVFSRYIDAAISKTINVPNNYAYEDFKNVYMQAYDSGYIKGITTYREGTMANVLSVKGSEARYDCAEKETPERPKSVPCHIHRITVKGEKWLVFVGLDEGRPFEVFAGKVDLVDVPSSITEGSIIRLKSGVYQLEYDGEIIIKDIGKIFDSSVEEAMTRMISLHLQRRTPLYDLIDQLSKSYGTIIDFNKSITRALKKYMKDRETTDKCPTCGANLVYQEGCLSCRSCGMAKCG